MGLTERHWFENEEPELTDRQLEDAVSIQDRVYRRGYHKGYSDGSKEQEKKIGEWIYKHDNLWYCSKCGEIIYSNTDDDLEIHHAYCSRCGAKMKQEGR